MYSKRSATYLPHHNIGYTKGMVEELRSLWKSRFVGATLFQVRLSERYQGSGLGVLWSVVAPVLTMIVIAIIFPLLMRMKVENYVVYLFSGLIVWKFISSAITAGGDAAVGYKALITKVALPSFLYPVVVVSVEFVNFVLILIALHGIALLFGFDINTHLFYLLVAMFVTLLFCVGIASFFSLLVAYYRDVRQVLDVIVQACFYLTPIIYPITMIPEKYHMIIEFNVFYQFVRIFHQAIYQPGPPVWQYMIAPAVLAIVFFLAGLAAHHRFGRQLVFRV